MRKISLLILGLVLIAAIAWGFQKTATENGARENNLSEREEGPDLEDEERGITISPLRVLQGDPAMISINGLATTSGSTSSPQAVRTLTFNGKTVGVFNHNARARAFLGIDLRMAPGSYPIVATLSDGTKIEKTLEVAPRQIVQAPLGIPEKLGGNTPESERELINTLVREGALISAVPTSNAKLWSGEFRLPLDPPIVVTDTYGYSRITGASSISHKGTDFRAAVGTPVYAMNSGVVRFNRFLRNYGNTIIVDHGLGLHTIYMHLSESLVALGQEVGKGEMIGKSGDTGYVFGPHLHLTIRINGISIDPEKFIGLF